MNDPKHTAEQLRLAATIIETRHPWEFESSKNQWGPPIAHGDIKAAVLAGYKIRLALATPPDGRPLLNWHNLTAEQVGAGYRLLLVDDRFNPEADVFIQGEWCKTGNKTFYTHQETYRLPISVPWPEAPKTELTPELKAKGYEQYGGAKIRRRDSDEWEPCSKEVGA